jgi:hypothetical protein
MNYRLGCFAAAVVLICWLSPARLEAHGTVDPVDGVYVYGPPTAGQSTSVYHYPKNWRGPRYAYPQTYYFKFPPFRRPVHLRGGRYYLDQNFFSGATTNAEIWAIRRKGEVPSLPASARMNYPAQTRLAPVIGPFLPNRAMSRSTFERTRTTVEQPP